MKIETERLCLRYWEESDAEVLYEMAKDPDVGPACGWQPHKDIEETKTVLKNILMNDWTYAIVLKETGAVIGLISHGSNQVSRRCENENQVEIGFWLGKAYWGNGYMPEACKQVIKYCFENLQVEKVWCGHSITNEKSKRVQEKCGFKFAYLDEKRSSVVNVILREN